MADDPELARAIAASQAEAEVSALTAAQVSRVASAFSLNPTPAANQLEAALVAKLQQLPALAAKVSLLAHAHTVLLDSPPLERLVLRLGGMAFRRKLERFENLGLFQPSAGSAGSVGSDAPVLVQLALSHSAFVAATLGCMGREDVDAAVGPTLLQLASAAAAVEVDDPASLAILKHLSSLLTLAPCRQALGRRFVSDIAAMRAHTGAPTPPARGPAPVATTSDTTLFAARFFSSGVSLGGPYIAGLAVSAASTLRLVTDTDVEQQARLWSSALQRTRKLYKEQMHVMIRDSTQLEHVLAWLAALLEFTRRRLKLASKSGTMPAWRLGSANVPFGRPPLLVNITSVLLQFCQPFSRVDSAPHQAFVRLDWRWLLKKHRADLEGEASVATGAGAAVQATASSRDPAFEMEDTEAQELAEAIRMSLGADDADTAARAAHDVVDVPEKFHFVTETFFLTLQAVHVGLVPQIKEKMEVMRDYHRYLQHKGYRTFEDMRLDPQVWWFQRQLAVRKALFDEQLLTMLAEFFCLVGAWLARLASDSAAAFIFAQLPEFYLMDMGVVALSMAHEAPEILATSPDIDHLLNAVVLFIDPPGGLVHSAVVRQKFVEVIVAFAVRKEHPAGTQRMGSQLLLTRVYANAACRQSLVASLVHLYIDVGYEEGAVEVFDKNHARRDITMLFFDLWTAPDFQLAMRRCAEQDPRYRDFALAVLSDATFLFNDALWRLKDVRLIQLQLANGKLASKEREEQQESLARFGSAAKGFLAHAKVCLKALHEIYACDPLLRAFFARDPVLPRLAMAVHNFLVKLCGPQAGELNVDHPEEFGWDPVALLKEVGVMAVGFAHEPYFLGAVVAVAEDAGVFECALAAATKNFAGVAVRDVFAAMHRASLAAGKSAALAVAALPTPPEPAGALFAAPVSALDTQEVDLTPCDTLYRQLLFPHLMAEVKLSDGAVPPSSGKGGAGDNADDDDDDDDDDIDARVLSYSSHHYAHNISHTTGQAKAKMTRLLQELRSLTPDARTGASSLPLAPGAAVFLRRDRNRMDVYKFMVSGPVGTPYFGGLFEFHMYIPDGFPDMPPLCNLETTGGNQFRFNPNLYSCGKVCLSLLGTWHGGAKGEGWDRGTSTMLQVFVSIQSLILVEDPMFNEPGENYNNEIRLQTLKLAMIDQLRNPPHGFADVVRAHFTVLGPAIVQQYERWARLAHHAAVEGRRSRDYGLEMDRRLGELKRELAKLPAAQPTP